MSNKQKLLIYSEGYIYGGTERLISFLIRNPIIQENYFITFVYGKHKDFHEGANKEYNDREKKEILLPVLVLSNHVLFYKINVTKTPAILRKIIKLPFYIINKIGIYFIFNLISHIVTLKRISPDIIHIVNGGYPGASSCSTMVVAAKLLGFNNIIYQVNNMAQKPLNLFSKCYDRFINKNVDYFITASIQAKEKLLKERKFDFGKMKQVPNTVLDEIPLLSRNDILNSLCLNQSDFILCAVGHLQKGKGQQFLLAALNLISRSHTDIFKEIKLLLVGNGEEECFLKYYVKKHGLSKHVYFLGYQNRSVDYINACDLFIFPSIAHEDMPLVVLTAMSKGKTIIATDFAGIQEEIENGVSGILVSPNTETLATALADKIVELYYYRDHSLGQKAQKRYQELFSYSVYGRTILDIYNSIYNMKAS